MHNFGQPPAPRTRNNLMESRPCFSTCPIGGAGGAYWVKAPLQPGLEELEAHMESTTTLNPGIQGPVSKRDGAEDRRRRLGQLWQVLLLQRLGAPHQKV